MLQRLGAGGEGKVMKATQNFTKLERAVKVIERSARQERDPKVEAMMMSALDHPNLVKLYECLEDGTSMKMVLGLCAGGCLFNRPELTCQTEAGCAALMEQCFRALRYLHKVSILHGDLVPANVMLQYPGRLDDNVVQIADFGMASRSVHHHGDLEAASRLMQALLQQSTLLGCVGSPRMAAEKRLARKSSQVEVGAFTRNGAPLDVSSCAMDLMEKLMKSNRGTFSAGQALRHPWIIRDKDGLGYTRLSAAAKEALERAWESIERFASFSRLKQTALHILAEELEGTWVKPLRELFVYLDCNFDGSLSANEFRRGFLRASLPVPDNMAEVLIAIDGDSVGALDYSVFIASMLQPSAYTDASAARVIYRSLLGIGAEELTLKVLGDRLTARSGARVYSAEDVLMDLPIRERAKNNVSIADIEKVLSKDEKLNPDGRHAAKFPDAKALGKLVFDSGNAMIPKKHWAAVDRAVLRQSKWQVWGQWQSAANRAVQQKRKQKCRPGSKKPRGKLGRGYSQSSLPSSGPSLPSNMSPRDTEPVTEDSSQAQEPLSPTDLPDDPWDSARCSEQYSSEAEAEHGWTPTTGSNPYIPDIPIVALACPPAWPVERGSCGMAVARHEPNRVRVRMTL